MKTKNKFFLILILTVIIIYIPIYMISSNANQNKVDENIIFKEITKDEFEQIDLSEYIYSEPLNQPKTVTPTPIEVLR